MQTEYDDFDDPTIEKSLYSSAKDESHNDNKNPEFNGFKVAKSPLRYYITEFIGAFVATVLMDGVYYHSAIQKTPAGPWDYLYLAVGAGAAYMIALIIAPDAQLNPTFTLALACLEVKPWKLVPGIYLSQFIAGVIGHAVFYNSSGMFKEEISSQGFGDGCDEYTIAQFGIFYPNPAISNGLLLWNTVLFNTILIWCLIPAFATSKVTNPTIAAMMVGLLVFGNVICTNEFGAQNHPTSWFSGFVFMWIIGCHTHLFYGHAYFYWVVIIGPYISVLIGVMGLIGYWILIYHEPSEWGKVMKMYWCNCPAIFTIVWACALFITYELVVHYNPQWNIAPSPAQSVNPIQNTTMQPFLDN